MEELQNLLAHLKNQGLTDAKIPIDVWCGIIEYFANKQEAKQCNIADVVEPKGKLEMFQNMQYYMEHCQREGYITPQDWLEKEKHF